MADKPNQKQVDTIAARANGYTDPNSGGVVPPIQPSTTFLRDDAYNLVVPENSYGRDNNDQVRLAEEILCSLEGGQDTLLFATGMAAIAALVEPLKSGDTLLLQSGCYWGTTAYLRKVCAHREIALIEADATDTSAFCESVASERPKLVLVETPSNPWIRLCDVPRISQACKNSGSLLAVDATAATPVLMQPLQLGADIVMHSATKAINGHSDVLAGVLTCKNQNSEHWQEIMAHRAGGGAILSAHDAWMLIRGMRTLPLRIERMCENALAIAEFLSSHAAVQEVWYPGLSSHVDHALADQHMSGGYGYLMSFLVKGGREEALTFCRYLDGIHRATSLGGTESLVEHRHTIEGELTGCPENLIRLSAGIENKKDLINELDQALRSI
ncbi:MAG: aminotransferase class V-fold PLP-dependent enzyme [Rhizobiaceae bacterium]|nr:aminotransferase class V-fold PLP-dependent enzyme [Rhizobiaceae bacterium]